MNNNIYLKCKRPHLFAFKNLVFYKTFGIFVLFLYIHQFINYMKDKPVDSSELILLPIFLILFYFIFIYPFFIPIHYSIYKYKTLDILENSIEINNIPYKLDGLEFSQISRQIPRIPISWEYLIIKKDKDIVGKYITNINNQYFFDISTYTIVNILNMRKDKIKENYNELIMNEFEEEKELKKQENIMKYILAIPLIIIFFFFLAIR